MTYFLSSDLALKENRALWNKGKSDLIPVYPFEGPDRAQLVTEEV